MMTKVLLVAMTLIASTLALTELVDDPNSAKWKCQRQGFKTELDPELHDAWKRCVDKKIKSKHCVVSCVMQESGLVKDGKWEEDKAKKILDDMWDKNQPDGEARKEKFWNDSKTCVNYFVNAGKKFPKDYSGNCDEIVSLEECAMEARKCPK